MKFNPNNIFFCAVLLGLFVSGAGWLPIEHSKFIGPILSVIILMVFHGYAFKATLIDSLRQLPDGRVISQTALADACYYLGFIFTLFILFSAFVINTQFGELGSGSTKSLGSILTQFAVGLFTTGYGLAARIHLSMLTDTEEADPEELRQRLTVKTLGLIGVIEGGITQLSAAVRQANESIAQSALSTHEQLTSRASALAQQIDFLANGIKQQASAISFTEEVGKVKTSLSDLGSEITSVNKKTTSVALAISKATELQSQKISEGLDALKRIADGADVTAASIESLRNKHQELNQALDSYSGRLAMSSSSTEKASILTLELGTKIAGLSSATEVMGATLEAAAVEGRKVSEESLSLSQGLQLISSYFERLGSEMSQLTGILTESITQTKNDFNRMNGILNGSAEASRGFEQRMSEADRATGSLSSSLSLAAGRVDQLSEHVSNLDVRLAELSRSFESVKTDLGEVSQRLRSTIAQQN